MKNEKFSIIKRIKSFCFAFNGLKILFIEEHNARIHLVAIICSVITGYFLQFSTIEWISVIFCFGLVIICEIFNSAIENISDFISIEKNSAIKRIKDLAAAAVFISALTAFIIGSIIVFPKLIRLF